MSAGPLRGITVVAIEQAVAGPFATRQLADLGRHLGRHLRLRRHTHRPADAQGHGEGHGAGRGAPRHARRVDGIRGLLHRVRRDAAAAHGRESRYHRPYGPYRTCDGAIVVAVHSNREWAEFCAHVLRQPALGADPRFTTNQLRVQHRDALTTVIEAVFSRVSSAEALRRLEAAHIANANVNTVREYLQHPQLTGRDVWREVDSPAGPVRALVPPVRMEGAAPVMGAVPALGQHTRTVLEELAFDRETIARWAESGVI